MNTVILTGHLTADPEIQNVKGDKTRCTFRIGVQRDFANPETGNREADFVNIVCWGKLGENCKKHLHKGSRIGVIGSLRISSYTTEDGSKRSSTAVRADRIEFLSAKKDTGGEYRPDCLPDSEDYGYLTDEDAQLPF